MLNVLNGGRHADNNVDFQEFQGSQCAIWGVEDPQHLSGLPTRPSDRQREVGSRSALGLFFST